MNLILTGSEFKIIAKQLIKRAIKQNVNQMLWLGAMKIEVENFSKQKIPDSIKFSYGQQKLIVFLN